jgi:hypothetical protein
MLRSNHKQINLRSWSSIDNEVYPLILNKNPQKYNNGCSLFLISKDNKNYSDLWTLIQAWLIDVKMGKKTCVPSCDQYDMNDFGPKEWYVVDLRINPDLNIPNLIRINDWEKCSEYAQQLIMMQLYKSCKFLVVFADQLKQVPTSIVSVSNWAMTDDKNTYAVNELLLQGTSHTPQNHIALRSFSQDESHQKELLVGYHRFGPFETYCYWPCLM